MGYIDDMNKEEEHINYFNNISVKVDLLFMDMINLMEKSERSDLNDIKLEYVEILKNINSLRIYKNENINKLKELDIKVDNARIKYDINDTIYSNDDFHTLG